MARPAANGTVVLHTPAEAGTILRCSEKHVYRLIAAGVLRAVDNRLPGSRKGMTRVRSDDIAAYIDAHTRVAAKVTAWPGLVMPGRQPL